MLRQSQRPQSTHRPFAGCICSYGSHPDGVTTYPRKLSSTTRTHCGMHRTRHHRHHCRRHPQDPYHQCAPHIHGTIASAKISDRRRRHRAQAPASVDRPRKSTHELGIMARPPNIPRDVITTGDTILDEMLGGGIRVGMVLEFGGGNSSHVRRIIA